MRFLLFIILIFFAGCSGITVDKQIKVNPDDWVMSGGSPEQLNRSAYVLVPPLNIMWDYNIEGGVGPSGITASDAVVFVNALQGELFTFDVNTGGKIGNLKFLGKDCSTAPLISGNNVIFTFAGDKKYSVGSYNLISGKINWRKNYGDIQTSPVMQNDFVYFGGLNGNFYKIDISGGKMIWKFNSKGQIHSTCALADSIAVFGNDKGFIYCINTITGGEKWKFKSDQPVISTPLIFNNKVFIGGNDSNYYCLSADDGKEIWKVNLHSKIVSGSSVDSDGNLIIGCVDGSLFKLSNASGEILWKASAKGTIISSPVISGNNVYISSYDSYVYSFDINSGQQTWKSPMLENKIKTQPVIWREYLFVAADEIVYCFTSKIVEKKF